MYFVISSFRFLGIVDYYFGITGGWVCWVVLCLLLVSFAFVYLVCLVCLCCGVVGVALRFALVSHFVAFRVVFECLFVAFLRLDFWIMIYWGLIVGLFALSWWFDCVICDVYVVYIY